MTLPTTEEALAWYSDKIDYWQRKLAHAKWIEEDRDIKEAQDVLGSLLANRDVLERHEEYVFQEEYVIRREVRACKGCSDLCDGSYRIVNFPCPTYLDILQRIEDVM